MSNVLKPWIQRLGLAMTLSASLAVQAAPAAPVRWTGQPAEAAAVPAPAGAPSRQAEAYRDGWEDYRLLTLLAASKHPEAKKAIEETCALIPMDREPLTGTGRQAPVDFEAIRLRLLRAAAASD